MFGSVRKQADADRLSGEFGEHFMPLIFDVTDEAAVLAAARQVREALNGETLAGLVNNAGIAVAGPMLELSADEFRRQMDVNVIGPVIATQAFGPLLGSEASLKGPRGRVVMISSVAGRNGNPLTAPYSASKHALEGLSESLRRELMLFGIDVIIVAPGRGQDPDLEQGRGGRYLRYKNSPYLAGAGKGPRLHVAARLDRIAGGKDRRDDLRGADGGQAKSALPDHAGPDAPPHDRGPAQAHGRPDHGQASWVDAADMKRGGQSA